MAEDVKTAVVDAAAAKAAADKAAADKAAADKAAADAKAGINANVIAAQAFGITKALTDKYPELFTVWQLFSCWQYN